jgi:hypothetical protein
MCHLISQGLNPILDAHQRTESTNDIRSRITILQISIKWIVDGALYIEKL